MVAIFLVFVFPDLQCFSLTPICHQESKKGNIDISYRLTKYGHKISKVNIFQDICKAISFFPHLFLTLTVFFINFPDLSFKIYPLIYGGSSYPVIVARFNVVILIRAAVEIMYCYYLTF